MMDVGSVPALARSLRCEIAKLRRARVLVSVLAVPAGFVLLKGVVFIVRGRDGLGDDRYTYTYLLSIGQMFWDRLLVPLLTVTVCAWLVWLEEDQGHWKVLLAQPIPRGVFFLSKLIVACSTVVLLQFGWWLFHAIVGVALGLDGSGALAGAGNHAIRTASALTVVVAVQLLLSVLLRSPFVALGIGIIGNAASLVFAGTALNRWHPWGLAQVAGRPGAELWLMGAVLAASVALSWAGTVRFARQDA